VNRIDPAPQPGWVWNGTYWMPADQYAESETTATHGTLPPYPGRIARLVAWLRGQR
jgi:hypothetical protein